MSDGFGNTRTTGAGAIYRTSPGIVLTSSGGRFFLVTPLESIEVNESAVFYWKCMEKGATAEEMLDAASLRYEEEEPDLFRRDIRLFTDACLKKQLITTAGGR